MVRCAPLLTNEGEYPPLTKDENIALSRPGETHVSSLIIASVKFEYPYLLWYNSNRDDHELYNIYLEIAFQ